MLHIGMLSLNNMQNRHYKQNTRGRPHKIVNTEGKSISVPQQNVSFIEVQDVKDVKVFLLVYAACKMKRYDYGKSVEGK